MAVSIVHEYPAPREPLRRLGNALVSILGPSLIVIGLGASILPILYLAIGIAELDLGKGFPAPDANVATTAAVAVTSLIVGLRLVRGKRRLVLFLRRFGFVDATQAVTFAVVRALGRNWRLVTLDDAEVSPVGVRKRMRWLSVAAGVAAVAVVALALLWVLSGGVDTLLSDATKDAMRGATLRDFLPRLLAGFLFVPMILLIGVVLIVFIPAAFAGAVAIFAWSSYRAIRRAERAKTVQIAEEAQIEPRTSAVLRGSRGIVGPRLAVAKVASSIWQLVVRRLASVSSAVVVDISEPTKNLLWEIEMLGSEMRARCILVGEQAHLLRMTTGPAVQESSPQARLLKLLDGEEVLAYSSGKRELARFARSLRARLDALRSA